VKTGIVWLGERASSPKYDCKDSLDEGPMGRPLANPPSPPLLLLYIDDKIWSGWVGKIINTRTSCDKRQRRHWHWTT